MEIKDLATKVELGTEMADVRGGFYWYYPMPSYSSKTANIGNNSNVGGFKNFNINPTFGSQTGTVANTMTNSVGGTQTGTLTQSFDPKLDLTIDASEVVTQTTNVSGIAVTQ